MCKLLGATACSNACNRKPVFHSDNGMKKTKPSFNFLLGLGMSVLAGAQPVPQVTTGSIQRLENFPSKYVAARHVDVWLPDGYMASRRYNVIDMQDGQSLFDPSASWTKSAWHVDVTVARLMREKRISDTIVVGIANAGKSRWSEYFPEKFLPWVAQPFRGEFRTQWMEGTARSDAYLHFLVEELKPAIDQRFSTLPDRDHTFVMGSSMGGLIAIYAMTEYPQVFGGAAGLSTHWVGTFEPNAALPLAAFNYLQAHLADPREHRLYMDRGTTELDVLYAPYQQFVDELVRDRGYTAANFMSRVFVGEGHNEAAWAKRLEIPLLFLLGQP